MLPQPIARYVRVFRPSSLTDYTCDAQAPTKSIHTPNNGFWIHNKLGPNRSTLFESRRREQHRPCDSSPGWVHLSAQKPERVRMHVRGLPQEQLSAVIRMCVRRNFYIKFIADYIIFKQTLTKPTQTSGEKDNCLALNLVLYSFFCSLPRPFSPYPTSKATPPSDIRLTTHDACKYVPIWHYERAFVRMSTAS